MLTRKEDQTSAGSGLSAIELERIVSLREAARLRGVSVDTIKRNHPTKIIRLSQRRLDAALAEAQRCGTMKFFNAEYRRRREAASARGRVS
jgi:hypothetical protein